jgi:hypothetical protein
MEPDKAYVDLQVLKDKDGMVQSEPNRVLKIVEEYYRETMIPWTGSTGKDYTTYHRNYPWKAFGAPDRMDDMRTNVPQEATNKGLGEVVGDWDVFEQCVNTLSSHKAPGPDGLTNDVLKLLPVELKRVIHDLFKKMWEHHTTPEEWKHSNTVLLHKKLSVLELKNYRPICLANTLFKLWSRLVHYAAYEFAEQ